MVSRDVRRTYNQADHLPAVATVADLAILRGAKLRALAILIERGLEMSDAEVADRADADVASVTEVRYLVSAVLRAMYEHEKTPPPEPR